MEVKLDKRYPLDVDSARAWRLLTDVPATAGCMPGAAITEKIDDTHYKGSVKVKVGPANAAFAGDIEVLALDAASRTLRLLGKGADRGGSSASMNLTATIESGDSAASSVLLGHAEVQVNGKFAQFGGRLMVQVSDMLLRQFVDNFRVAAAALPMVTAPEAALPQTHAQMQPASTVPGAPAIQPAVAALATAVATAQTGPVKANEINALAVFWHLLKSWVAGLFGKRA